MADIILELYCVSVLNFMGLRCVVYWVLSYIKPQFDAMKVNVAFMFVLVSVMWIRIPSERFSLSA